MQRWIDTFFGQQLNFLVHCKHFLALVGIIATKGICFKMPVLKNNYKDTMFTKLGRYLGRYENYGILSLAVNVTM